MRSKDKARYTRAEVVIIVLGAHVLARFVAIGCARAAAHYAARGDRRQADRFARWSLGFARQSMMFGERIDAPGNDG